MSKLFILAAIVLAAAIAQAGVPTISKCAASKPPALLKDWNATVQPDNITPGVTVNASITGTLSAEVTAATLTLTVKLDGIQFLKKSYDVCGKYVTCPIQKGPFGLSVTKEIPNLPISGEVDIEADITESSGQRVACMDVSVDI